MRKKIVAGNWKMNLLSEDSSILFDEISSKLTSSDLPTVMVFPPSVFIHELAKKNSKVIELGIQNFYPKEKGAFTGEISISQLKNIGATQVLIGHSERRSYFGESNSFLKDKVDSALESNLGIIFCCGEPIEIRNSNQEMAYVKKQIEESLFHLSVSDIQKIVIAYEPVWAIGTGVTASIDQAEEMHASIRSWLSEKYGQDVADQISILYGGSCNAANAKELFSCPNVDGGLIGGAALDAEAFLQIIHSF
jgi:triosephosphate isomerase